MPSKVAILVTAEDAGATKVLDNVTASSRATKKQAEETAKAQALAAKFAGDVVSQQSLRMVKAQGDLKVAEQDYARVQAATRKGYLDETSGAMAAAAAMNRLAKAKMEVVEANLAQSRTQPHAYLKESIGGGLGEHLGISESMTAGTAAMAAAAVVAGELAAKMKEVVSSALEYAETINRASEKTGLTTETLSVLHYAAATAGGDFDSMTAAIAKMGLTIAKAVEGNKNAIAFLDSIGIKGKAAVRLLAESPEGAEVVWKKMIETLGAAHSSTERLALAAGMMSKAGAEQVPTIAELATHWDEFSKKTADSGNMLDGKTAASLAATKQRLEEMKQSVDGAGLAFTEGFAPAFGHMLDVIAGGQSHLDLFKSWGEGIARTLAGVASMAYEVAAAYEAINGAMQALVPFAHDKAKETLTRAGQFDDEARKFADIANPLGKPMAAVEEEKTDPLLDAIRKRNDSRKWKIPDLSSGGGADKAAQKRLKAMEEELNQQKINGNATLKYEYDYWTERMAAFSKGSSEYDAIVAKRAALAVEGARKAHEAIVKQQSQDKQMSKVMAPTGDPMLGWKRDDARAAEDRADTMNELAAMRQRVAMQMAEETVRQRVGRTISQEAAAMQVAAIHTAAYGAELQRLEEKRKQIAENPLLSNNEADQQRKIDELTRRIAELQGGRQIEIQRDTYAIKDADQAGVRGATDALNELTLAAMDSARQMHELTQATISNINAQILNGITGKRTDFKGVGENLARDVAGTALQKAEGSVLGALGFGGMGKKDGSSEQSALWVQMAGGGGLPKLPGMTDGLGSIASIFGGGVTKGESGGGGGGFLSGLMSFAGPLLGLPGFADGVTDFAGGPAIVGERGIEVVNLPKGASVTPNHKLASGGTTTHINIDATGSTNPAETQAAVMRGIHAAAPHIIASSVNAMKDMQSRRPSSAR